jgi:2-succinyl-6-hydroxy-2,4-cyclohexadiene-1-carboxylate synthase
MSQRLVLLHGFTQAASAMDDLASRIRDLTTDIEPVCVDLAGHGSRSDEALDLVAGADALAETHGPAIWLGYSLGGRQSLHLAVHRPDAVHGLVLISSTAGIDDDAGRQRRREDDERLAARIESIGLDAFLDEWLAGPLFADFVDPPDVAAARRSNTAAGLAMSLRLAGTGAQESLWPQLSTIDAPCLVVTGASDTKFDALGDLLAASIPGAVRSRIDGAGHSAHLERPAEAARVVAAWLAGRA